MPFLRKAADNPFGLIPYDVVKRIGEYDSTAATAIFEGDLVKMGSAGTIASVTATTDTLIVGVAASSVASGSATSKVLVYDDPNQLYTIQDDGDTTNMAQTNIGNNVSVIGLTPSTTTANRSITEADSSTAAATDTLMLKILRLHPIENDSYASASGNPRKWVVQINPQRHYLATGSSI